MAIEYVREHWEGRESNDSKDGNVTFTRVFKVRTTVKTDDAGTVKVAVDPSTSLAIPTKFSSTHPDDSTSICGSIKTAQDAIDWRMWTVTVKYSRDSIDDDEEDPTARDFKVSISTMKFDRPVFKDAQTDAVIVNSAGDTFMEPPIAEDSRTVFTIRGWISGATIPSYILGFRDTLNDAELTIDGITIPIYEGKIDNVDIGERERENGYSVRPVTIIVHHSEHGWNYQPLDEGFHYLADVTGTGTGTGTGTTQEKRLIQVKDENGSDTPASSPIQLDGSGGINAIDAAAVYHDFYLYSAVDWTPLGLPA